MSAVAIVPPTADHRRPHDGAERVDDTRETREIFFVPFALVRFRVVDFAVCSFLEVAGAFAVNVLEPKVRKERIWSLWRVVMVWGFAAQGYGEDNLGLKARDRFVQPEDLFSIGLVGMRFREAVRRNVNEMITWPRVQTKIMAGTRSAN